MNPRQGPLARIHRYREASWGTDPPGATNEYLIPVMNDGFVLRQPRTRGTFYDGELTSKGSYLEPIDASGPMTTSLDYFAVGYDLMDALGSTYYTRVGGLHVWRKMSNPLPHGIRKEFVQAPAIIHRYSGCVASSMRFAQAARGQQQYELSRIGKGGEFTTDIAAPTLLDPTEKNVHTYFNGSLTHDGVVLGNTALFDMMIDRHITPKEGVFFAGELAAYSIGVPEVSGNLGKIFSTEDGDAFYLLGKNETPSSIICLYANKPLSAGPTMFLRFIMPKVLFDRNAPPAGGETIPDQTQHFVAEVPASTVYYPGHAIGTLLGPYAITAADNVVSVKAEGAAPVDTVLTNGAARTAAQIAAELTAAGPFAAAFTAKDLNGRLEIATKGATSTSSIQWATATANSAHTVLGFDNTTWTGYPPSDLSVELFNTQTADYT